VKSSPQASLYFMIKMLFMQVFLSQMVRKLSQEKRKAPAKINNGVPRLRRPRLFKNTTGFGSTDYKLISVKFVIQKFSLVNCSWSWISSSHACHHLKLRSKRADKLHTFAPDTTSNSTVSPSPTLRKYFFGLFFLMAVWIKISTTFGSLTHAVIKSFQCQLVL